MIKIEINLSAGQEKRTAYPTDLTDRQREIICSTLPDRASGGRPRKWHLREIVCAVLYILRSGCSWRMLPHDFPKWQTVYYYFNRWKKIGLREHVHDRLIREVRIKEGYNPCPSAGITDSQSVKTTDRGGVRGYDAGKKINGRKRHILTDTPGLIIAVMVHSAGIQDYDGARLLLSRHEGRILLLNIIRGDSRYSGSFIRRVKQKFGIIMEIVRRPAGTEGFVLLPRRRVAGRTFAWLMLNRRLSKDYEYLTDTGETIIQIAMIGIMLRRLAPG